MTVEVSVDSSRSCASHWENWIPSLETSTISTDSAQAHHAGGGKPQDAGFLQNRFPSLSRITDSCDAASDRLQQENPANPADVCDLDTTGKIPYNQEGQLTSIGSIKHESGQCIPCAFWFKGVCQLSVNCNHCHFLHEGQKAKRLRPSKNARQKHKTRLAQAAESGDGGEQGPKEAPPATTSNWTAAPLRRPTEGETEKYAGIEVASAATQRRNIM
eukprot:CAMPEP_0195146404 /NCGR_PEP_ID=MMETSP0448-20130528/171589_1 /TAXON_ID=66468 /ORGANISM="Heterocapsa triquestra, Strain CCMP 448" /LENGTH=215 /DNA_ID=CAMNT_0040184953 /DNA_START=37 /DNA_END=681 /DNA_ORIENTATION=+